MAGCAQTPRVTARKTKTKGSQRHGHEMVAKKEMGHEWLLIMRWSAGAHIIGALNGGVREVRYWLHSREMHDLAV